MQAAKLFNWAPIAAFRPNEELITIEVGQEQEVYHAHKNVLIRESAFFATALGNKSFKETSTGRICLPEVDARAFPLWLEWAYSGKLPSAALDAELGRFEAELPLQDLRARQRLISAASFRLLQAAAPKDIFQGLCDEFTNQNRSYFRQWPSVSLGGPNAAEIEARNRRLKRIELKLDACKSRANKVPLARLRKEIGELFDQIASEDPTQRHECVELKASFRSICENKLVASSDDPTLKQAYLSAEGLNEGHLDDNMRPAYINIIRMYQLADYLLSEKCKNMAIDAIAELSANSRYIPNAVDVGELWGYDNEVGDVDYLRSRDRQRDLKDLIRQIYTSKNTTKLLMEEEDPYPELFLRELQVLYRDAPDKRWRWVSPAYRCNTYHTHIETVRCHPLKEADKDGAPLKVT